MPEPTLLERTLTLYETRSPRVTNAMICKAIDVPYQWLFLVVNGRTKDPGVNRVERLYNYLSNI